jgi:alpha-galactosidase
VICRGVRKATGAEIVGLCHGVPGSAGTLAYLLGVNASELSYTAIGINHMTWLFDLKVGGEDAREKLLLIGEERLKLAKLSSELGKNFEEAGTAKRSTLKLDYLNPFSWQLYKLFNAYPVPGDRHLCEFFGRMFSGRGSYFGKTLGLDAYSFEATIKWGDKEFLDHERLAASNKPLPEDYMQNSGGGEVVVDIIKNIRLDRKSVFSVNLPNKGQVPNLPLEAVLEAPGSVDGSGIKPVMQKPLPAGIAGTLATRFLWAETAVDAAIEGSRDKFIQALILDGTVSSADQAAKLADDLLKAQAEYLPRFKEAI